MRPSPSIVPGIDRDIYLVLDDYGRVGRAWAETDEDHTSLDAVITELSGWSVSTPPKAGRGTYRKTAHTSCGDCVDQDRELPDLLYECVDRYAGPNEGVQLRLPTWVQT